MMNVEVDMMWIRGYGGSSSQTELMDDLAWLNGTCIYIQKKIDHIFKSFKVPSLHRLIRESFSLTNRSTTQLRMVPPSPSNRLPG